MLLTGILFERPTVVPINWFGFASPLFFSFFLFPSLQCDCDYTYSSLKSLLPTWSPLHRLLYACLDYSLAHLWTLLLALAWLWEIVSIQTVVSSIELQYSTLLYCCSWWFRIYTVLYCGQFQSSLSAFFCFVDFQARSLLSCCFEDVKWFYCNSMLGLLHAERWWSNAT